MAFNVRVLAALLLLFIAAKPSISQIIHGLTVGGRLCCTSTGNCPIIRSRNGTGVSAAHVHLDCNADGRYVAVGQSTTKKTGSFNITVPSAQPYSFEDLTIPCMVRVQLPLSRGSNCSPLSAPTNDSLFSALKPTGVGTIFLLGLVRNATITGFVRRMGAG